MSGQSARDAADGAIDPDRLLEGEDPQTSYLEDAAHWVTVYDDLLSVKRELLGRTEQQLSDLPSEARHEIATTDLVILDTEMKRFSRRLAFWRERCIELGGGLQA